MSWGEPIYTYATIILASYLRVCAYVCLCVCVCMLLRLCAFTCLHCHLRRRHIHTIHYTIPTTYISYFHAYTLRYDGDIYTLYMSYHISYFLPTLLGTTALVCVIDGPWLHLASAGDSRAVLCRGDRAVRLTCAVDTYMYIYTSVSYRSAYIILYAYTARLTCAARCHS